MDNYILGLPPTPSGVFNPFVKNTQMMQRYVKVRTHPHHSTGAHERHVDYWVTCLDGIFLSQKFKDGIIVSYPFVDFTYLPNKQKIMFF